MRRQIPVNRNCSAVAALLLLTTAATGAGAPPTKPIEATPVKLGRPVDFEKDVYPILENNCLACHNAGIAESKLSVETAESIRKGGKRGPGVVPKNLAASVLFQLASHRSAGHAAAAQYRRCQSASPQELGVLKQWILEGAKGGAASSHDSTQWQPVPASVHSIECVALSPWGRFAAAGRTNQIVIYDLILGQESAPARRSGPVGRAVRWPPDVSRRRGRSRFHSRDFLQPRWLAAGCRWISRREILAATAKCPQMERLFARAADGPCRRSRCIAHCRRDGQGCRTAGHFGGHRGPKVERRQFGRHVAGLFARWKDAVRGVARQVVAILVSRQRRTASISDDACCDSRNRAR